MPIDWKIFGLVAILLTLGISGMIFIQEENVNCDKIYNQTISEDLGPENIPERCQPIPREVENRLLAEALGS